MLGGGTTTDGIKRPEESIMSKKLVCAMFFAAMAALGCNEAPAEIDQNVVCMIPSGIDYDGDGIDDMCDPCPGSKSNDCAKDKDGKSTTPSIPPATTPPTTTTCEVKVGKGSVGHREVWYCGGNFAKVTSFVVGCKTGCVLAKPKVTIAYGNCVGAVIETWNLMANAKGTTIVSTTKYDMASPVTGSSTWEAIEMCSGPKYWVKNTQGGSSPWIDASSL
jgi:hypothetical protein